MEAEFKYRDITVIYFVLTNVCFGIVQTAETEKEPQFMRKAVNTLDSQKAANIGFTRTLFDFIKFLLTRYCTRKKTGVY